MSVEIGLYSEGKTLKIQLPSNWNELTLDEIMLICEALETDASKARLLMNIIKGRARSQRVKLPEAWMYRIDAEEFTTEALPLLENLLADCNLTRNPFPAFYSAYGPADDFEDFTVVEFEYCEIYANQYQETQDAENLRKLVQVLWRKKKRGYRLPYSDRNMVEASFFKRIPLVTLQVIYLWYTSSRNYVSKLFPEAFGGGGGNSQEAYNPEALLTVIHAAAGDGNGKRPAVRKTLLKEFLFECQRLAREQKRIEEAYNQPTQ